MADRARLDGMTAEWLLSIAKVLDHEANLAEVYDRRGMGGSMGTVSVFLNAASLCRAVANAERAMAADDLLYVEHAAIGEPPMLGFIAARNGIRIPRFALHPTLAAALGAVTEETK